ncbi:MAG: asparagine synthase (glutamine-hydrolyzing) [Bacteroidales bacterium]|nr:asparagine synthase (glutamine-hydrolyzing) [Bacteroidales bacterium]
MCGIAGYYSQALSQKACDVRLMTQRIAHRGPDAEGSYTHHHVALGQRRLSIIDLSEKANQPMISPCGRYVVVYNGEIYNFRSVRQYLQQHFPSYRWQTQSDTEVVLAAFMYYGEDFVTRLQGMFALAIYDNVTEKLYLYRDRVGIKPLYYYYKDNTLVFASELKAITAVLPQEELQVNPTAVNHYLHLAYIPAPYTIYEHVYKFPQAHKAVFDGHNLQLSAYWQLQPDRQKNNINEKEAKQQLHHLLEQTVEACMFSDVPFGTFLSGGIDSSLMTAIAQSLSATPINTFSIGFYDKHNEAEYAGAIAKQLGTHHHELYVTHQDIMNMIPELLSVYDEPYADSSALPTLLLSHMTKQHVTMAISGDGGDELFMGYGSYIWAQRLNNKALYAMRYPLSCLLAMGGNREKRVAKLLQVPNKKSIRSHIFSQEQFCFTQKEIADILLPSVADKAEECALYADSFNLYRLLLSKFNEDGGAVHLNAAEQQSLFDFQYYLPDDLLVKVDRASMHYSLEVRVPFLEQAIVEYAYNLPSGLRMRGKEGKYLLKQVLYDYIPREMFARPKWGFSIPLQRWLQKDLSYLIDEELSSESIASTQIFNNKAMQKLIRQFRQGNTYLYNRLWLVIVLQRFMKENLKKLSDKTNIQVV